jgi:rsbT antagonist protein RsbS
MERIPILRLGHHLLVSIQVDLHDRLALTLQDDLTSRLAENGARGVLLDISSLEIVDSFIGRMIGNIAAMARVLDAHTVVVGMRPAVAITLVELGISMQGVRTAIDVDDGMRLLEARRPQRRGTLSVRRSEEIPVREVGDIVAVRQQTRQWAGEVGLSLVDQTKIVTAASELARNAVVYGGGGSVRLELLENGVRKGLRLVFADQGPGIPDVERALQDGFTTGGGLGLGLGGARRW